MIPVRRRCAIRQAPSTSTPVSTVDFVGVSEGNNPTFAAHVAGDFLLVVAFTHGTSAGITTATGFTNISSLTQAGHSAGSSSIAAGWRIAPGAGTSVGTWTGTSRLVAYVFSNVHATSPIEGADLDETTGTSLTCPALPSLPNVCRVMRFATWAATVTSVSGLPSDVTQMHLNTSANRSGSWLDNNMTTSGSAPSITPTVGANSRKFTFTLALRAA